MANEIVVLDEQKMLERIQELPLQLEKAWTTNWIKDLPIKTEEIDHILLCGMGGSGIAGNLLRELYSDSSIPIDTWADYGLPGWVNEKTLVIPVSYSGDTEETIDALQKAIEKKCQIFVVTSGGKIKELAEKQKLPCLEINYKSQPRAAIGWLYGTLLTALAKLKLINLKETDYFKALEELRKTVGQTVFRVKAEELAMTLSNKVPMTVAHSPLTTTARRWVTQLNENSKTFAFAGSVPELCHNTVVGLDFAVSEKLTVLYLSSAHGHTRNLLRQELLQEVFEQKDVTFIPLTVRSSSALVEQWLFIYFGDLLSYFLAGVNGVDPTPIESISILKEGLSKS